MLPQQIYEMLNAWAPTETAEPWDNVGLLVHAGGEVTGVLCALDITHQTVAEAKKQGCSVIVSHHPVIFHALKKIDAQDIAACLLQNGISAICMHTNLDKADGGVNDALAHALCLEYVVPFGQQSMGRIGTLPQPMAPDALAAFVGAALHTPVKLAGAGGIVQRVAVCGGSGAELAAEAAAAGAQALVTGEAGHHDGLDSPIALIAATHYATEAPVVQVMAERLRDAFPTLHVVCSETQHDPFTYING